ncbi:unnamed protein product [Didymodactylos carnosus]|uniref:Uncharacterized protein n=1 Tax=Didymodactylos carnosus TaxID=1234261 RepID=A0A814Q4S4_9BILA|nr:unnamed protein product [Didymodactylos carnosus]CAF1115296.1 unnamed protein product [Didymodactylos carnosus]CAF3735076.1 unnamed protein product [Didymodactylos carnosus]CAF3879255.1 unnamed protein product [Didymodactylos carnosus]
MICINPNGIIRWKVYIEHVPDMIPTGVSNIVVDRNGTIYYIVSWANSQSYTANLCRITQANTDYPNQLCVRNYQLFGGITQPLAYNEIYDLLITAVVDNKFGSVSAAIDKTSLEILWINRHYFGAGTGGHYKIDNGTGYMYWIGDDDYLLKFDQKGNHTLIDGLVEIVHSKPSQINYYM